MTSARTCASCGAELSGDVRWCVRCYAPVRELTPRAPVWGPGEFVDTPIVTRGAVPHWSRWEKSQTTFGPFGRIAVTTVIVLWAIGAVASSLITAVFVVPVSALVIRAVWRPGWVVPPDQAAITRPPPPAPMSTWLWDRGDFVETSVLAALCGVGVAILVYVDDPIPRFIVIVTGVVVAAAWGFRKVAGGR